MKYTAISAILVIVLAQGATHRGDCRDKGNRCPDTDSLKALVKVVK